MSNNVKKRKKLAPKQVLAITHLANGKSYTETAKLAGVSRQTINNWINDPDFKEALNNRQSKLLTELSQMYFKAEMEAFEIQREIMTNSNAKDADRLRAANQISQTAKFLREQITFEERMRELEDFARQEKEEDAW